MKKITILFILFVSFCNISCDTLTQYTLRVSVDRNPTLIIVNETGHPIVITAPLSSNINNSARIQYQPSVTNGIINITYRFEQFQFTEQVTWNNMDTTVKLTKRPPTLTIVNDTGAGNNVNIIQFRSPRSVAWIGGNIIIRNNELHLVDENALTGVTTQVLTNGEKLDLWLGNLRISGDTFDIRLQTPNNLIFQKDNVRIPNDMSLTFTQSDRR